MNTQISLEDFETIYNSTYNCTLRYIVCKCSNIEDVNDLVQETYEELYKILLRKKYITLDNYTNYIIGIAKNRIKKHYGILYNFKIHSIWETINDEEFELEIPDNIDIEADLITKLNAEQVWQYIKKKDITIIKIFYLYFYSEMKISQIATALNMSESNTKNLLYRTIKDIKKNIKIEGDIDV